MSGNRNEGASADRRWLIGIAISLFFGLFGVVMALLAHADRTKASVPAVAPSESTASPLAKPTMAPAAPAEAPIATSDPAVSAAPLAPDAASPAADSKKKKHSK